MQTYYLAIVVYFVLALRTDARDNYTEQEKDYNRTQEELTKIVDEEAMQAKLPMETFTVRVHAVQYKEEL